MRLRTLTILLLLILTGLGVAGPSPSPAGSATLRPNFVVIVVDDLDSQSLRFMPAVESNLISEGASFSNFFATTPLCCPSRASILRGQYAHNHGVLRNTGKDAGFATFAAAGEEQATVATMLDGAGYNTALVGKYLNGYAPSGDRTYIPPGWDYWVAGIDHDAYNGFDYSLNVNGEIVNFGERADDYSTDVLSTYALDFLDQYEGTGQPFFLYLAPYAPHSPMPPAPRHKGMFNGATAPRGPAFDERNVRDKPQWVRATPRFSDDRISRIDDEYQRRLESLQAVDDMVAAVEQRLQAANVLDSTYIIFLSDNGMFLGEHRQPHGKDAPYDPAARIPLIITGPSVPHGSTVDQLALNIDLAPTIADLTGLAMPVETDGRSLTPIFNGTDTNWRSAALLEGFGNETESLEGSELATPAFRALRSQSLLYVEYETGERELYDLRRDPDELANLAHDAPKAKLRELSHQLDALSSCAGQTCHAAEDDPAPKVEGAHVRQSHHHDHKNRHKERKNASRRRPLSRQSTSAGPVTEIGGSANASAAFRVRMPKNVSAASDLVLQIDVASVTTPGTLVASLLDGPAFGSASQSGNDERVGTANVISAGQVMMRVSALFGDSGPFWITISGRDGAHVFVSTSGSKLAPRLATSEQSHRSNDSAHRSRSRTEARHTGENTRARRH